MQCPTCNKSLPAGSRKDKKFCSVSCRAKHHNDLRLHGIELTARIKELEREVAQLKGEL
jgi:hypothetical protein